MSIRARVYSEIDRIRQGPDQKLTPLTDDMPLLDTGLDSLGIAVLVTRLEDDLGVDPFASGELSPPVTLRDLIRLYETAVPTS
jgi:acyl carrier protein